MYNVNPNVRSLTESENNIRITIMKAFEEAWERIDKEYSRVGQVYEYRVNALLGAKRWDKRC